MQTLQLSEPVSREPPQPPGSAFETGTAVSTLPAAQTQNPRAIRPLPERDTVYGHRLEQAWRQDQVRVFARSFPDKPPHEYEVIIVMLKPEKTLPDGTKIPARFAYPSNSDWGKLGWSIPKRQEAIAWAEMVLANLTKAQKERTAWPLLFSRFKAATSSAISLARLRRG
jgi:hypothetical protein